MNKIHWSFKCNITQDRFVGEIFKCAMGIKDNLLLAWHCISNQIKGSPCQQTP